MARLQGKGRSLETAREQYETVREALQIAGEVNGWMVRQINFIMGTRSIEVSSWDKSMQELGVSKDRMSKGRNCQPGCETDNKMSSSGG
jgi:hypothetical protein